MDAKEKKKNPFNIKLVRFECNIKLLTGSKKYISIDFAPIMQKDIKGHYKDSVGNLFEIDLISFKNKIFIPPVNFELFHINESKFSDNFKLAYWGVFNGINDAIEDMQVWDAHFRHFESDMNKELFKEQLKALNISHSVYFKKFDRIYNNNIQNITDISDKEMKFLKSKGFRKITRESAFWILLYRHMEDKDFLLGKFDLNDEDSIKDLWEKFYLSYRKRKKKNT